VRRGRTARGRGNRRSDANDQILEGAFTNASYDGRDVWVPTNPANMLYFRVPTNEIGFVAGEPVYVRIEYHDAGRGKFLAQYDSNLGTATADKFKASEMHTRSSRVGQGGYVYSYQCFEFPLFGRRQNGVNDFRIQLQGSDGTPLRVASVQISTTPYDDEKFQFALSRPWLQPYSGPVNDFVDRNTLVGKVMTGYQGWFATPNDADDLGWRHWGRSAGVDPSPTEITVDMWPYMDEYRPEDRYPAGNMVLGDGSPATLFSSRDPATVQRHFHWMRKHNIDGAYLQRFVSRTTSGYYGAPEFVLNNVRAAANLEGRVWAIEYDISSLTSDANPLEVMTNDWNFLVNDCHILEDARYAHENGKPVLFIWGFSVPGREGIDLAEADAIVDWFKTRNLYLIIGVRDDWESRTDWHDHYQKYDQLLAWMEGDQTRLASQKTRLDGWGMKILPHTWPGFSWHNLQKLTYSNQYTARDGGNFYWGKLYNALSVGADQIFLGMFDEYDEATAIMPMSDNPPEPHTEWGHYITNEGRDPFWYLQLSEAAREMLNGFRPLSSTLPQTADVFPGAYGDSYVTVHLATNDLTNGLVHNALVGDGTTSGAFVGGHNCRTLDPTKAYFYFNIDNAVVYSNAAGQKATVEIEFFDDTSNNVFRLQYDGLDANGAPNPAYTTHPVTYTSQGSATWRNLRWNVSDALFAGRQNGSSDFRIQAPAGTAIRRVSVFFSDEPPDTTPLTLDATFPPNQATDAGLSANLAMTFSKDILANTGNIVLKTYTDDATVESIAVGDAKVTISGNTVAINPTANLTPGTQYYVLVDSGAVRDNAWNLYDGISDKNTWTFTAATPSGTTVGYWRFDNDGKTAGQTAGMVRDESGYGNDGSAVNSPLYSANVFASPVPRTGAANTLSLDFERTQAQYITIPDDNTLDFGDTSFTIEAWFKFESVPSDGDDMQWIVNKRGSGQAKFSDYGVAFSGPGTINYGATMEGELVLARGNGSQILIGSGLTCTDLASWHYVSVAFDADNNDVRFILDDATSIVHSELNASVNGQPLAIGGEVGFRYFDGLIDEVRISNAFLPVEDLLNARPRGTVLILQ